MLYKPLVIFTEKCHSLDFDLTMISIQALKNVSILNSEVLSIDLSSSTFDSGSFQTQQEVGHKIFFHWTSRFRLENLDAFKTRDGRIAHTGESHPAIIPERKEVQKHAEIHRRIQQDVQ